MSAIAGFGRFRHAGRYRLRNVGDASAALPGPAGVPARGGTPSEALATQWAAEQAVMAATERYHRLRTSVVAGTARGTYGRWPRLAFTVLGTGILLGTTCLGFLATAYFGLGPALVVPAAVALGAVVYVTFAVGPARRRPVVADLVRAAVDLRRAETELRRVRERTRTIRERSDAPRTGITTPPRSGNGAPQVRPAVPPDVRRLVEATTRASRAL